MYTTKMCITIPFFFKTTVFKKNNLIIIYNESLNKYACFYFNKEKIKYSGNSNGMVRMSSYIRLEKRENFIEHILQNIIKSWDFFFFKKFKFKSKGLKIKRRRKKCLKFLFWLSHIHLAKVLKCKLRRIGKQKYIFISTNWIWLQDVCKRMRFIRPNDLFTKKGIRFGRQIVLKKKGKKESRK